MTIKMIIGHIRDNRVVQRLKEKMREELSGLIKRHYNLFRINNNKIVFDNFGGKGYGGHPRYIAEEIHKRGLPWDIVWLVDNDEEPMPDWIRKVRIYSWKSIYQMATAKYWVDNVRFVNLVPKKEKQVYLQTWHDGSIAIKLIEKEIESLLLPQYVSDAKYDGSITDGILSSSKIQSQRYKASFWLNAKTEIVESGGPSRDCLFDSVYISERRRICRNELHIGIDDYIIIYAPTFRDDGSTAVYQLDFDRIINAFSEKTGKTCRVIIRLHPNVMQDNLFSFNKMILDGTKLVDSNDALICSDCLITDFSSMLCEASLLNMPIFRYASDYNNYVKNRPLFPCEKDMPFLISKTIDELICQIKAVDFEEYKNTIQCFLKGMDSFDTGNASKIAVDWLQNHV